jgi:hypothetical protein
MNSAWNTLQNDVVGFILSLLPLYFEMMRNKDFHQFVFSKNLES